MKNGLDSAEVERTEVSPSAVVAAAVLHGNPFHAEVVLDHLPSGTLVVADMIENLGHDPGTLSWLQAALLRWSGMERRPTPPTDWKLTVSDPAALRRGVDTVLAWPIERLVPAHGAVVVRQAHAVFSDAFAFVR